MGTASIYTMGTPNITVESTEWSIQRLNAKTLSTVWDCQLENSTKFIFSDWVIDWESVTFTASKIVIYQLGILLFNSLIIEKNNVPGWCITILLAVRCKFSVMSHKWVRILIIVTGFEKTLRMWPAHDLRNAHFSSSGPILSKSRFCHIHVKQSFF